MNNDFMAAVKTANDHAREVGAIKSISTTSTVIEDQGIPFMVRVVENLARKEKNAASNPQNPFLPYDPDLYVTDISDTHVCLLNKFNVVDHHVLFVTRQYESQQSLLTAEDFEALWFGLCAMDGVVFYNSCPVAGASQKHKHLQMVPCPLGASADDPVPLTAAFAPPGDDDVICHSPRLAFPHAYARVAPPQGRSDRECAEALRELYMAMLQTLRIWKPQEPAAPSPYNLLVSRQWLWMVPRSRPGVDGVGVNALGFAGTFLLKHASQIESLKAIGPLELLRAVT